MRNVFLSLVLVFISFSSLAARYEINKDHSRISFKVPYMSFSEVEGAFTDYEGEIEFDLKKIESTKVSVKIKAGTVDTLDKKRDHHLRGPDFFNVEKYPMISFNSTQTKKLKENHYKMNGLLEIRSIKKAVVLNIEYKGSKKDHADKESLFFKVTTMINRKDFGIVWNKSIDKNDYLVGDNIEIEMVIQAQPFGEKTAFSTHMMNTTVAMETMARARRGEIERPNYGPDDLVKNENVDVLLTQQKVQVSGIKKKSDFSLPWKEMFVGFIGFCFVIVAGIYVKTKLIKILKVSNYSEISFFSYMGDALIIAITYIYSIWYFKYLYP